MPAWTAIQRLNLFANPLSVAGERVLVPFLLRIWHQPRSSGAGTDENGETWPLLASSLTHLVRHHQPARMSRRRDSSSDDRRRLRRRRAFVATIGPTTDCGEEIRVLIATSGRVTRCGARRDFGNRRTGQDSPSSVGSKTADRATERPGPTGGCRGVLSLKPVLRSRCRSTD